jgi:hypothetical protein
VHCAVELFPENVLAWNLYWDSRSSVADVLGQSEKLELGEAEASDLAIKLRTLTEKMAEIEVRQTEQQTQEMKNASSAAHNRTRR